MSGRSTLPDPGSQIGSLIFAWVLVDEQGRIAEANPAAESLLGRSVQRLVGQNALKMFNFSDARVIAGLNREDAPLVARDVAIESPSDVRRVNVTSSPLMTRPGWRVVTLSDAGQGRERDEESLELRAPGVLAHEIKNPLAAIRGASQLLSRRVSQRDYPLAEIIQTEVDRIASLIDSMQQLGSSTAVEPRPCNLHQSIRSAVATVRAGRKDPTDIAEEFDPSLPPVLADPRALEQVLINLIANASEACESVEGARIEIKTRFVSGLVFNVIRLGKATRLPVEITVTDNGPGVTPSLRDHIFEPFVSSKPKGQGLGLALVRKLVRDMGGSIAHERDDRAGLTHFRINIAVSEGSGP